MTTSRRYSFRNRLVGYIRLPHTLAVVIVLIATAALAVIATHGTIAPIDLAILLMTMLGAQLAIGASNELVDVELDRAACRYKPIPAGLVSERGAKTVVAVGLALMVIGSMRFSLAAFGICLAGTAIGVAYSLWFKRTMWSWLPYVLAIPLLPVWVLTALEHPAGAAISLLPIALPALTAVHLGQSIPDIATDRQAGVKTLATLLGPEKAHRLTAFLLGLGVLATPFLVDVRRGSWLLLALAVGIGCLPLVVRRTDAGRADRLVFPLTALALLALAVAWGLSALTA